MSDMFLITPGVGEYEEKKSKFIAHIENIENEEDATAYINNLKKQYWDARHNCYAYVLGDNNEIQRFSDDGEPGGTAGKPILEVINGSGLRNVVIVVTRYFGGVLLGTGGLVRAYQKSSIDAIDKSGIAQKLHGVVVTVNVDYGLVGKLQYITATLGIHELNSNYGEKVDFEYLVPDDVYNKFLSEISEVTAGAVEPVKIRETYYGVCDGVAMLL